MTLPAPTDPPEEVGRWRLAVADEDVPQHTWYLAPVGAPLPPMVLTTDREFDEDWGPLWGKWSAPMEGKVDIWMQALVGDCAVTVAELLAPHRAAHPSDTQVVLTIHPPYHAPRVGPTPTNPLHVVRFRLGIQSAHNDWRIITSQAYVSLADLKAAIVLEHDNTSGDLYTLIYAAPPPEPR